MAIFYEHAMILKTLELETAPQPTASIIWLHGLGANGHDFEPIVPELHLPADLPVRFIFPHAPMMAVTINGGMMMPAWYDIKAMDIDRVIDTEQLTASAKATQDLIDLEIERGIDAKRIVVAGFSQGGAVAYQAALTYPKALGGMMNLSTYFATHATIEPNPVNQRIPIFIGHGVNDPIVPDVLGKRALNLLREKGYEADYHSYAMEHSVCWEEIQDISAWIQNVLNV